MKSGAVLTLLFARLVLEEIPLMAGWKAEVEARLEIAKANVSVVFTIFKIIFGILVERRESD
jgi:hypothetical protein